MYKERFAWKNQEKTKGGLAYLKINLNEKTKRRTVWMTEEEMKDECLKQVFQDAKP